MSEITIEKNREAMMAMGEAPNASPQADATNHSAAKAKPSLLRRLAPVGVMLLLFASFFLLGLDEYLSFEALREHRTFLADFVANRHLLAVFLYILLYAVAVALSFPGATLLTITGGFLFGAYLGTLYTVIGATVGAVVIFQVARSAFGDSLKSRAGGALDRVISGFGADAFNYMLLLRLVPIFPFFIVNLAPAFASVRLRTYTLATFIGIIPGTFVYVNIGAGLGGVFDQEGPFNPAAAVTTEAIVALVGLGLLSLLPVVYRRFIKK